MRDYKTYHFRGRDPVFRELRDEWLSSKLTISELSYITGISSTTLHRWFNTKKRNGSPRRGINNIGYYHSVTAAKNALRAWRDGEIVIKGKKF